MRAVDVEQGIVEEKVLQTRDLGDAKLLWAGIALVVQLLAYVLVRLLIPSLAKDISEGQVAQGVFLGALSLAIGILNAACMADGL